MVEGMFEVRLDLLRVAFVGIKGIGRGGKASAWR
jgi:hypothetical protein